MKKLLLAMTLLTSISTFAEIHCDTLEDVSVVTEAIAPNEPISSKSLTFGSAQLNQSKKSLKGAIAFSAEIIFERDIIASSGAHLFNNAYPFMTGIYSDIYVDGYKGDKIEMKLLERTEEKTTFFRSYKQGSECVFLDCLLESKTTGYHIDTMEIEGESIVYSEFFIKSIGKNLSKRELKSKIALHLLDDQLLGSKVELSGCQGN
mgnify:CR=1 FL=1